MQVEQSVVPPLIDIFSRVEKRYIHFSNDLWSSRRREAISCVLAHFIDEDWKLVAKVVGFKTINDRHSAVNVNSSFQEVLKEYDLELSKVSNLPYFNRNTFKDPTSVLITSYDSSECNRASTNARKQFNLLNRRTTTAVVRQLITILSLN